MNIKLTQKQAQAILSASITFSEKELKPKGNRKSLVLWNLGYPYK